MTTYCLDPSKPFKAIYNLNMWTMPTDNVVFSYLTADITSIDTTLNVTVWEWALFKQWEIATIEQLNSSWKVIAREVILIADIDWDELTVVRWTEECVVDDTASPKVMWNTPLDFTAWAKISVYVSKALLTWVQVRLSQINCPCNTCVYEQEMETTTCIANNCDIWRDALYQAKARCRYNDCWFWDWSLWDCVIDENTFLCANCDYNFKNLTICEWVLVRFEWQWVPRINVQRKFCNMWTIDLRGWTFVWACSKCDWLTGCSVWNNACQTCYNAMCYGCAWWAWAWSAWYENACPWCNATIGCWWDWGCWGTWRWYTVRWCWKPICEYCWVREPQPWWAWSPASWYNGWNGWNWWGWYWDSYAWLSAYGCTAAWWWGWWWY